MPTVVLPPVMLFTLQVTGVALPAAVSCCEPLRGTVNAVGETETGAAGVGDGTGVGVGVGVGAGVLPPPPQATRPNRIRHSRHEAKILLISSSSPPRAEKKIVTIV